MVALGNTQGDHTTANPICAGTGSGMSIADLDEEIAMLDAYLARPPYRVRRNAQEFEQHLRETLAEKRAQR